MRTMYQVEVQDEETGSWKSIHNFVQQDTKPDVSFFVRLFVGYNYQPQPEELRKQARVVAIDAMGNQSCRISEYIEVYTDRFDWQFERVVWQDNKWLI